MKKRAAIARIVVQALVISGCNASDLPPTSEKKCNARYNTSSIADVIASVESVDFSLCPSPFHSGYWGADDRTPETYVTNVVVSINGAAALIPLSVYSSLAEVTDITLEEVNGDILLTIRGGQGDAAGYVSIITFSRDKEVGLLVKRQRTYGTEFPDEAYEETQFSFPIGS